MEEPSLQRVSPRPGARLRPYAELLRPANLVTAGADVLAGFFVATGATTLDLLPANPLWLILASIGLYGGGVALNDALDAEIDAVERPERPIPRGAVPRRHALRLGFALLAAGSAAAFVYDPASGLLAVVIAGLVLLYDARLKHHAAGGPIAIGLCRGLNLLLGLSTLPWMVGAFWWLALIPLLFTAGIGLLSRGEVHGGGVWPPRLAAALVGGAILGFALLEGSDHYAFTLALPFALLLGYRTIPPFVRAARSPSPERCRGAVGSAILSLIALDAALAAGFAGLLAGLVVLALHPLSRALARRFAVT